MQSHVKALTKAALIHPQCLYLDMSNPFVLSTPHLLIGNAEMSLFVFFARIARMLENH